MFSYRNKTEGLSKVTSANISETVRDSDIVTMDNKQKWRVYPIVLARPTADDAESRSEVISAVLNLWMAKISKYTTYLWSTDLRRRLIAQPSNDRSP